MQITIDIPGGTATRNATLDKGKSSAHEAVFELDAKFPDRGTISAASLAAMKQHAKGKLGNWNINGNPVKANVSNKVVRLVKA